MNCNTDSDDQLLQCYSPLASCSTEAQISLSRSRSYPQFWSTIPLKCLHPFLSWLAGPLCYNILIQHYSPQPTTLLKTHLGATIQPTETIYTTSWSLILWTILVSLMIFTSLFLTSMILFFKIWISLFRTFPIPAMVIYGDQVDKDVAFGLEVCEFESSYYSSTSPLCSPLLTAAPFLKLMHTIMAHCYYIIKKVEDKRNKDPLFVWSARYSAAGAVRQFPPSNTALYKPRTLWPLQTGALGLICHRQRNNLFPHHGCLRLPPRMRKTTEQSPMWISTTSFHQRSAGSRLLFLVGRTR